MFYSPFSKLSLVKAEESNGKWEVFLEASNENEDEQKEITVMKSLQDASKDYLKHGVISWDHQHRVKDDPAFIIGEPTDVAFSKNRSTLVKGILYQKNKYAQGVFENLLSGTTRFGASVGGWILAKAKSIITKVIWRDTAITDKAVNSTTQGNTTLLPFAEFAKALSAGSGVDASSFSGGRALSPESLRGATVNQVPELKIKNLFIDFINEFSEGRIISYKDLIAFIENQNLDDSVASQVLEFIVGKVSALSKN